MKNNTPKKGLSVEQILERKFNDFIVYVTGLKRKDYYLLPTSDYKGYEIRPKSMDKKFTTEQTQQLDTLVKIMNDKFKTLKKS